MLFELALGVRELRFRAAVAASLTAGTPSKRISVVDISAVAPTICRLMGVEPPTICRTPPLEPVLALAPGRIERVLAYAADAIGRVFLDNHPDLKKRLVAASDVQVELRSMPPPKTPVCYASMFTGAQPEVHGIRKYERPVLTCDTLFDALARRDTAGTRDITQSSSIGIVSQVPEPNRVPSRSGNRVAIVAVRDCSVDIIFRNRAIDYFTQESDQQVIELALELVRADKHDFIVAYNQEYDDVLHRTGPESPEAVAAAQRHVEAFVLFRQATEEFWAAHSRALLFAPDHGGHTVPPSAIGNSELGISSLPRGDHGADIPEDMDVLHFWRVRAAR